MLYSVEERDRLEFERAVIWQTSQQAAEYCAAYFCYLFLPFSHVLYFRKLQVRVAYYFRIYRSKEICSKTYPYEQGYRGCIIYSPIDAIYRQFEI